MCVKLLLWVSIMDFCCMFHRLQGIHLGRAPQFLSLIVFFLGFLFFFFYFLTISIETLRHILMLEQEQERKIKSRGVQASRNWGHCANSSGRPSLHNNWPAWDTKIGHAQPQPNFLSYSYPDKNDVLTKQTQERGTKR